MTIISDPDDALRLVRSRTDRIMVSFSRGKDSLATTLRCIEEGFDLVLVHFEIVPGLGFVERSLEYYERKLGVEIKRLPHPILYAMFRNGYFQTPERAIMLAQYDWPSVTFDDLMLLVAEDEGMDAPWQAVGVRAHESLNRRLTFRRHGCLRGHKVFPIAYWRKDDILRIIRRHGVSLPEDYLVWRRSFDGVDWSFLRGVREQFPDDYRRIKEIFPLIDAEVVRHEGEARSR